MDRMACVDVAALPLQLIVRRNAGWGEQPVAVLDRDRAQGKVLWVNERARAAGVLPGMTYVAALSLCRTLRAGEVPRGEIEEAVVAVTRRLGRLTPAVEPATDEPGVFWLDASGLRLLHDSLLEWARLVRSTLEREEHLVASVVVGFTRFGVYANARSVRGILVFRSAADEEARARTVSLDRLALEPSAREMLFKLGVCTVGAFADLPSDGIEKRLGPTAWRVYRLARGDFQAPVASHLPPAEPVRRIVLDTGEEDVTRVVALVEGMLRELVGELAARDHALAELQIALRFEDGSRHHESIRPAAPTRDVTQLLELVSLRLASVEFPDRASEVSVAAAGQGSERVQLDLFDEKPSRDLAAANRAIARVRAELGDDSVVHAALRDGHLPEALFTWERLDRIHDAAPEKRAQHGSPGLVRRLSIPAVPLPPRPRQEPDGWMLRGLEQGPVIRVLGPYIVAGGWWRRKVHREYHYAETQDGEILWVYYDRVRRRWFLQGRVE